MRASKKFCAFLTTLALMASTLPLAAGQGFSYDISLENGGSGNVILNVSGSEGAEDAKAVVAFYDSDLRPLKTEVYDVTAAAGETQQVTFDIREGAVSAKAFVWDSLSGMKPLSETAETALGSADITIPEAAEEADTYSAEFSDIDGGEDYADKVSLISEIGIMAGYSDNTFRADEPLTRGEAAKTAVNMMKKQDSARLLKNMQLFSDIEVGSDLCGAVNYCAQMGIMPVEGDVFRPNEPVTGGELIKAMVEVIGWHGFAEDRGGWPIGYIEIADQNKIISDVTADFDDVVSRGEAAKMIYNTLFVPIAEKPGSIDPGDVSIFSIGGNVGSGGNSSSSSGSAGSSGGSPSTGSGSISIGSSFGDDAEIQNGRNGRDYKTLLTKYFNIYLVEGYISETSKSNMSLSPDEVVYTIEETLNYDDMNYVINPGETPIDEVMNISGRFNPDDYLFAPTKALVKIDGNTAEIIRIKPSDKLKAQTVTVSGDLIDAEDYYDNDPVFGSSGNPYIRFYESYDFSNSVRYALDDDFKFFVNGMDVGVDEDVVETFLIENRLHDVKFLDRESAAVSADGKYDIIFTDYYATAKVGSVNAQNGRITFDEYFGIDRSSGITLDPDNSELDYKIYCDGERIGLSELRAGDIISIAYDVNAGIASSDFYEIYVSRKTATGKYTRYDPDKFTVTVGGKEYKFATDYEIGLESMSIADEYTLYLDAFGRIFDTELIEPPIKIAVLDEYKKSASDDYYRAVLYTANEGVITEQVDTSRVTVEGCDTADEIDSYFKELVYLNGDSGEKTPIQDRVVEYTISDGTGMIISLESSYIQRVVDEETYRASAMSVGSIRLDESMTIINAVDYCEVTDRLPTYSDLSFGSVSDFIENTPYTAYAYGSRNTDGVYPLLILTEVGETYPDEPEDPSLDKRNFAVILTQPRPAYDEETKSEIYLLEALYQGEEFSGDTELEVNIDAGLYGISDVTELMRGDVIVFSQDENGRIDRIDVLATAYDFGISYGSTYEDAYEEGTRETKIFDVSYMQNNWTGEWFGYDGLDQSKDITRILYGPVVDKTGSFLTLGNIAYDYDIPVDDGEDWVYTGRYTNLEYYGREGGVAEIEYDSNTNVYVYDFSAASSRRLSIGGMSDIMIPAFPNSLLYNSGYFIPWDNLDTYDALPCFVFVKATEDVATDILVILPD